MSLAVVLGKQERAMGEAAESNWTDSKLNREPAGPQRSMPSDCFITKTTMGLTGTSLPIIG